MKSSTPRVPRSRFHVSSAEPDPNSHPGCRAGSGRWVGKVLEQGRPVNGEFAWREGVVRGEVMQDIGTRAATERCLPRGMGQIAGGVKLVAVLEAGPLANKILFSRFLFLFLFR
jgi:hypothetical protein